MVLVGDDRHLKFTVSMTVVSLPQNKKQVIVTTAVHYHNLLGKLYFFCIRPFHGIIVPFTIKHILKSYL